MITHRAFKIKVACDRCQDRYAVGRHPKGRWDRAGVLDAIRSAGWIIQSDLKDGAPDLCRECQKDLKLKNMYQEFGGLEA